MLDAKKGSCITGSKDCTSQDFDNDSLMQGAWIPEIENTRKRVMGITASMVDKAHASETQQESPAEFVFVYMSESVPAADSVECGSSVSHQPQSAVFISPRDPTCTKESKSAMHRPIQASRTKTSYALLISMPPSPSGLHIAQVKRILLCDDGKLQTPRMPAGTFRNSCLKDHRFDSFKTWSGKLERQISNLGGKPQEPADLEAGASEITKTEQNYLDDMVCQVCFIEGLGLWFSQIIPMSLFFHHMFFFPILINA